MQPRAAAVVVAIIVDVVVVVVVVVVVIVIGSSSSSRCSIWGRGIGWDEQFYSSPCDSKRPKA